jgi:hypothetical protein
MRLIGVEITGYRRFEHTGMKLDAPLIAIVGPNEAGKTSLLKALTSFEDDQPIPQEEFTRGISRPSPDATIIRLWYGLDDADRGVIPSLPNAELPARLIVTKLASGVRSYRLDPPINRNAAIRGSVASLLRALVPPVLLDADRGLTSKGVADEVDTDDDDVGSETLASAVAIADAPTGKTLSKAHARLKAATEALRKSEEAPHPETAAIAKLKPRVPPFLWFGERDRVLQSEYDLSLDPTTYSAALLNLSILAGLDLVNLRSSLLDRDYAAAETLLAKANAKLVEAFTAAWGQSAVSVRLRTDETLLRLLVSNSSGAFTTIAERSDGLRTFVALVAFAATRKLGERPILLIDEAESHLHYDAQADIVRVLTRQQIATKVIYTTHSAGCLPEDLGSGIRAIEPLDADRSQMHDSIWMRGPGFGPLILAMGASVTAFSPTRLAVLAEGQSEAILLPTLIREATREPILGYQIAPGIASANSEVIKNFDLEAPRVAYLVDSDLGGKEHQAKLVAAGVPKSHIVALGERWEGLTLEDLLRPELYLGAVNEELATWQPGHKMPVGALAKRGRSASVRAWCNLQGIQPPSKVAVAARVLEMYSGQPLIPASRRPTLAKLHAALKDSLSRSAYERTAGPT